MQKRKVEELNVLDDFLFGSIVSYPGVGEEFCRKLLKVILGEEFGKLRIVPQKVYYGSDTDKHGTRLDVYIEEEEEGQVTTIYDIEPDLNDRKAMVMALPERVRYYHSRMDVESLPAGELYGKLKKVVVIMITPYDPIGFGRMVYTIQNMCREDPDIPYDDRARTLFLYTKGKIGNPPEELRKLLHYLEDSKEENADDHLLKEIHEMVEKVKHDKEVSLEYMKIYEREQMIREQGIEEGIEKGIEQGEARMRAKMEAEIEKERASAEARLRRMNELILKLLEDGRTEDAALAVKEEKIRERLMEEYQIL